MSKPKRHHFVPESYLKGFANTKDGFLYIYSKQSNEWRRQKPKEVMVINKYYHQDGVPDGVDKNILENTLGSEIEPKGLMALQKLIKKNEKIDCNDVAYILRYLEFQRIRVPRQANMAKTIAKTKLLEVLSKDQECREVLKQCTVTIKDSIRFDYMKIVTGLLSPYFSRMTWEVVGIEDGLSFITSDSPVSFFNSDFHSSFSDEPGIALYGTMVLFPINKHFLLVLRHPEYAKEEKGASESLPMDLCVEDGVIELRRGKILNEDEVQLHNAIIYDLAHDLIVGESNEILEQVVDHLSTI
ncbi:MAG: DUF4238 domain-containing protein [Candidatus Anammoxibacter sp.]